MSDARLQATLRRLFDVIASEAARNPGLAYQLAQAIGQLGPAEPQRSRRRRAVAAADFHAVNVLRLHGEGALRGKLEQVKAVEDLKSLATAASGWC